MTPAMQTKYHCARAASRAQFYRVGAINREKADVRNDRRETNKAARASPVRGLGSSARSCFTGSTSSASTFPAKLRERARGHSAGWVNYFLKKFAKDQPGPPALSIAPVVLKAPKKYPLAGQREELENIIRRALVMSKGEAILLTDFARRGQRDGRNRAALADRCRSRWRGRNSGCHRPCAPVCSNGRAANPKMKIIPGSRAASW